MRTTHCAGAVQLCLVLLGAAAGSAHRLEKRAEKDDQHCWPKKLGYPRIKLRTFGIIVHWNHFSPKSDCLENNANYVINITWVVEDQHRYEQKVPVEQDSFTIGSLSPWTKVDILVSLCYTDRDGNESCGEPDDWNTGTSEGHPSKPRTFKVSEVEPNVTTFAFEAPENPNGPLDGYTYEVCKVNSCADKPLRGFCGTARELKRHQHSFQVEGLAPLAYYMIHIWAYNKDSTLTKKFDGEYAELCIRSSPSGRSTITTVLKEAEKWLNVPTDESNSVRARPPKHVQLERSLQLWFTDVRARGVIVNDAILTEKAKVYGTLLGIEGFNYSAGWLSRFKNRSGIRNFQLHGEAASVDETTVALAGSGVRDRGSLFLVGGIVVLTVLLVRT